MAHKTALLLVALIMFTSAYPLANAQIPGGGGGLIGGLINPIIDLVNVPIQIVNGILAQLVAIIRILSLSVSGILRCPGSSQPVAGAVVSLNCTTLSGVSAILGQSTTNANGSFNISILNVLGILRPALQLPCNLTTNLINQTVCPLVSTVNGTVNGVSTTLTSALSAVSLTLIGLLRALLSLTATGFVNAGT